MSDAIQAETMPQDDPMVAGDPTLEYASPSPTIFHGLRVSKRCVG